MAVNRDGRVRWANRRMERLLPTGVRPDAAVVETIREPNFLAAVQTALRDRCVCTKRASSIAPGKVFEVTAAPMAGGDAVAVLHDLTEIERVEKTRRDFIANVSHELRTPLTNVQGYAETLLETAGEDGPSREFLEIIRKNAARMTRITEDLLILAKVESGEEKPDLRPLSPALLLEDAAENFRENEACGSIKLMVENQLRNASRPTATPSFRSFRNLIDNALKYAASGGRAWIGARDVKARSNSSCATTVRASPRNICHGCSSASTGSTRRARARAAAPDWGWQSPSTLSACTAAQSGPKAS